MFKSARYVEWRNALPPSFSKQTSFNLNIPVDRHWKTSNRRVLLVLEHVDTEDLRSKKLLTGPSNHWVKSAIDLGLAYAKQHNPKRPAFAAVNFNFFKTYDLDGRLISSANTLAADRVRALVKRIGATDVIVFGDNAAVYLMGNLFKDERTQLLRRGRPVESDGVYWTSTISPSLAYQGKFTFDNDKEDDDEQESKIDHANLLGFVSRCVGNALTRDLVFKFTCKPKVTLIDDMDSFKKLYKKLMVADIFALDTETASLGRVINKVLTLQVAFSGDESYLIPLDHKDAKWKPSEKKLVEKGLRNVLSRPFDPLSTRYDQYILGQNLKFDMTVIRQRFQIHMVTWRLWDMMAGEFSLDENMKALIKCRTPMSGKVGAYSLEWMCAWYGCDFYANNAFSKDDRATIETRSLKEKGLINYCGMDAQVCFHIRDQQLARAKQTLVNKASYKKTFAKFVVTQMNNLVQIESVMEHRGDKLDMPYLIKLKDANGPLSAVKRSIEAEFKSFPVVVKTNKKLVKGLGLPASTIFGGMPWVFSVSKPAHKIALFIDTMRLEPISYGKSGVPSIDKPFQEAYKDIPAVASFSELSQLATLKNTYVNGFYARLKTDPDMRTDFRIRPGYGFTGTVTGRSNSYEPNLQNIPARGKFAKFIKRMFVAPRGCLTLKLDYSAHEVRMWGILSGDTLLCSLFINGRWLRQQFRKTGKQVYKSLMDTKGDIHKVNCVAGDALISTDRGLVRIDQLSEGAPTTMRGVDFKVSTLVGVANAAIWKLVGTRRTVKITTEEGNALSTTYDHQYAVWSDDKGEIEWVAAKNLKIGDRLCVPPKQALRKTPLILNCPSVNSDVPNASLAQIRYPKRMTPGLAKLLAYLVSEGTVASYTNGNVVIFSNTDEVLIQDYVRLMKDIFGLTVEYSLCRNREAHTISGVTVKTSKPMFGTCVSSKALVKTLEYLGVYTQVGRVDGKVASHFKVIPWSVMQADSRSQAAFLAAYLEGDGNIENVSGALRWFSTSHELLTQMQTLINAHGGVPSIGKWRTCEALTLNGVDSAALWAKLQPFMVTKRLALRERISNSGVPTEFWRKLIKDRLLNRGRNMVNDDGNTVSVPGWKNYFSKVKSIPYVGAWAGMKDMMRNLKRISNTGHNKLELALNQGLRFVVVNKIEDAGSQKVYDLGIENNSHPSFTANGLLVHNCEFFFKVEAKDVTPEQRNSVKSIVFGAIYGRGAKAIAAQADAAVDSIKKILVAFFDRFKKASGWLEWAKAYAVKHGNVSSPIGRVRNMFTQLYGIDNFVAATERRGCNAPVQGLAADIGHTSAYLYQIHIEKVVREFDLDPSKILRAGVNTFVHDAIKTDAPYEYLLVCWQVLQWCATTGSMEYYKTHFGIQFPVEIEIEIEIAAHDEKHWKHDWHEGNGQTLDKSKVVGGGLRFIIRKALEDQKEVYPDIDVDAIEKTIWAVRDNKKLMSYLDANYPILADWPDANHIDIKSKQFTNGLGKLIKQLELEEQSK